MVEQEILAMLTCMLEDKDIYTAGHSKRVAMYSARIAQAMGLGEEEQIIIYQAGLLHDIGKILTPESVLFKPRKFNRTDYNIIKKHSIDGEKMVSFLSSFKEHASIIRHHHERFDGKGYPDGLKGEDIPFLSRIMSIADAFDAMTTNRIYKARKGIKEAIFELKKCLGAQFDPYIVSYATEVFMEFKELTKIKQVPKNAIDEERFAYFFKDALTGAYSSEYLNHLLNTHDIVPLRCCYLIQMHHMKEYNERFGWKCGDNTLKEIALRVKVLFHSSYVFRVFGDDFIVLNALYVSIDKQEVLYKLCVGLDGLSSSVKHLDFSMHPIQYWEKIESFIVDN